MYLTFDTAPPTYALAYEHGFDCGVKEMEFDFHAKDFISRFRDDKILSTLKRNSQNQYVIDPDFLEQVRISWCYGFEQGRRSRVTKQREDSIRKDVLTYAKEIELLEEEVGQKEDANRVAKTRINTLEGERRFLLDLLQRVYKESHIGIHMRAAVFEALLVRGIDMSEQESTAEDNQQ